uniref:Uncharacterized protein n=1 Tax=Arundo donax TaxID=35708 RepID=A0A0A9HFF1_ARUDO
MVQLLDIDYADDGGRYEHSCRMSFPVMDLVSYLLSRENFVAVLNNEQRACPSDNKIWRLSIRGGRKAEDSASLANMSLPQLRSLSVFSPAVPESIDLNRSQLLRVLDLEGCDLSVTFF